MSEHNETTIVSSAKYMADMQELYRFTERQFLEFDEIVPMRLNKEGNVVSPKLYFLLMAVCGQVESVTRHICKELGIPVKKNDGFGTLYNKLRGKFSLIKEQSVQIVMNPRCDPPLWRNGEGYTIMVDIIQQCETQDSRRHGNMPPHDRPSMH